MKEAVPTARAERLTDDRVIEILADHLSGELDDVFGRSGDPPFTDDGIFLPDPDPDAFYRQPAPTDQQTREVSHVAVFCGRREDPSYGAYKNVAGDGKLVSVQIPYAVSFVFGHAHGLGPEVDDPVLSRKQDEAEIINTRASYYEGGLRHTLEKWGHIDISGTDTRANAVDDTHIDSSFSTAVQIRIGPESRALKGQGFVQLTIDQWQILPPDHTT